MVTQHHQPRIREITCRQQRRGRRDSQVRVRIIGVVVELLESGGYEGVQLREVARRSRVSLATIYRMFGNQADLIIAALEHWLARNSFASSPGATDDETVYEGLMRILRQVFEPWERSPTMLRSYHMAQTGPGGERLDLQGYAAIDPIAHSVLADVEPSLRADIELILTNMVFACIGRFASGEIDITEILPILERAVFRITANDPVAARPAAAIERGAGRP